MKTRRYRYGMRRQIRYIDGSDFGGARARPKPAHESPHRFLLTTSDHLHAAIREIPGVTANRKLLRASRSGGAIKHTLHPARNYAFFTNHSDGPSQLARPQRVAPFLHKDTRFAQCARTAKPATLCAKETTTTEGVTLWRRTLIHPRRKVA